MESQSEVTKRIEAQDLISRFRIKEDLNRYLTQQSISQALNQLIGIVNLFLPSIDGTKIGFLRAILKEEQKAFKIYEIIFTKVLNSIEISVNNLYDDALKDIDVEICLGTAIKKLPQRKFFFGVLGTVNPDYLSEIIQEARKKRFLITPEDLKKTRNSHQ